MISQIPEQLKEKYKSFLGNDYDLFISSCFKTQLKTIKINKLKFKEDVKNIEYFTENSVVYKKINNLDDYYVITSKISGIGNTIEQLLGFFQIHDLSSIIPVIVLDPNQKDVVLDMTAAPGIKTFLIAEYMKNKGLVVANDLDKKRLKKLIYTLKKNGVTNAVVTNQDSCKFNINIKFDKVLLDAPCSCEGFFLKNKKGIHTWSNKLVLSKASLQKKLIQRAFDVLKKDGVLVYSTCTLSPEENEEVVDFLLKRNNACVEDINLNDIKTSKGLVKYKSKIYDSSLVKAVRIYPHKTNTEGFFICKLRKI
jgi:tRNA (cytosine49-C5)-methyltransferase